eukprot:2670329-Ditylum_brightwellii.AAC.1
MLAMLQHPLSMMAKLSCNHENLAAAIAGNELDATEFVEVKLAIQDMICDPESCVNNDTIGNLFICPHSTWAAPIETNTPTKTHTPIHDTDKCKEDRYGASGGGGRGSGKKTELSKKKEDTKKRVGASTMVK